MPETLPAPAATARTGQSWTIRRMRRFAHDQRDAGATHSQIRDALERQGVKNPWDARWLSRDVRYLLDEATTADLCVTPIGRGPGPPDGFGDGQTPEQARQRVDELLRTVDPAARFKRLDERRARLAREVLWDDPVLPAVETDTGSLAAWCPLCRGRHGARSWGMVPWASGQGGPCRHADAPPMVVLMDAWDWEFHTQGGNEPARGGQH